MLCRFSFEPLKDSFSEFHDLCCFDQVHFLRL
jgi:hypothetical protein